MISFGHFPKRVSILYRKKKAIERRKHMGLFEKHFWRKQLIVSALILGACWPRGGEGASFDVHPGEIAFSVPYMTLLVGDALRLEWNASPPAEEIVFSSSVPSVAAVDESGTVTALASGMTLLTIEVSDGRRASLTLRVRDPGSPSPG